jgi:hypothetical protein
VPQPTPPVEGKFDRSNFGLADSQARNHSLDLSTLGPEP